MQDAKLRKVLSYEPPREFWEALLEVRNYWILDRRFADLILRHDHNGSLRQAFFLMDNHLDRVLQDWDEELK